MIQITCTSCKNVLSIDDAFAGGVCRCQHCGTIQTVPAKLKAGAPVEVADASAKLLYQNKARGAVATGSGSGLEDLAGIVASSGLADGRLRKPSQGPSPRQKNQMILLGAACGVIVLLLAILAAVLFHNSKGDSTTSKTPEATPPSAFSPTGPGKLIDPEPDPGATAKPNPTPHVNTGPNCCGIKLTTNKIVYLIDNGSSSSKVLDPIKAAIYRSIESLGPDTQFSIIFWNPDSNTFGPATATADQLKLAKAKIEDVIAFKSTEPVESLKKALASNPGEIILITAKGLELEVQVATDVLAARGNLPAKIHVIDINGSTDDLAAKQIAEKTGGTFAPITESQLETAGD